MVTTPTTPARDPATGWSVWGQHAAVAELRRSLDRGPGHAYIFSGPSQAGKRAAALDFARSLCCPNLDDAGQFCGLCNVCRRIGRGVFPDVTVFDLKSQTDREKDKSRNLTLNISTVREITGAVSYRPMEANWRVVVVDDVETMQETAQEAFLKTLEEPPGYAILILITSDAELLLPTICSRCIPIRFGLSPSREIQAGLEASGVDPEQASRIVSFAQGSPGWAFAAADEPDMIEERERIANESVRFVLADGYDRLVTATFLADDFSRDRSGVFTRLQAVQGVWRAALYRHQGLGDGDALALHEAADRFRALPLGDLVASIRAVDACIASLEANVRPRLALEAMVLAWPLVSA